MSTLDTEAQGDGSEDAQPDAQTPQSLASRLGFGAHKASYDDINVPVILMVGFISAVLTFASIAGVQALYYYYEYSELTKKSHDVVHTPNTQISDEQQAKLTTYGHTIEQIDSEEGKAEITRITIPLDEAIPAVLAREAEAQNTSFPEADNP